MKKTTVIKYSIYQQDQIGPLPELPPYFEVIGVNENGKKRVTGAKFKNVKTGETYIHECEGIFLGIGHKPNTDIFKGQIELEDTGYIKTNKVNTATNIKGVFACGDAQDSTYRQAVTAAGSGCMSAIDVERYLESIHG